MKQGEKLRSLVTNRHISVSELSDLLGVTRQYLYVLYLKSEIRADYQRKVTEHLSLPNNYFEIDEETANESEVINLLREQVADLRQTNAYLNSTNEFLKSLLAERLGRIEERLSVGKDDAVSIIEMYPEKKPAVMKVTRAS